MTEQTKVGWAATAVILALILPALYMGAYYALLVGPVVGKTSRPTHTSSGTTISYPDFEFVAIRLYRIDSPTLQRVLEPARRVDRWIRPDRWTYYQ